MPKHLGTSRLLVKSAIPSATYDEELGGYLIKADRESTRAIKSAWPDATWETKKIRRAVTVPPKPKLNPKTQSKVTKSGLYRFQVDGVRFLVERETALLADEMGLGKTVQSVVAATKVSPKGRKLVVVPNTLVENWLDEIEAWTPDDGATIYFIEGGTPKAKRLETMKEVAADDNCWLVVSWDVMRIHATPRRKNSDGELTKIYFDVVIADEAHRMKNRKSLQAQAIKRISSSRKYALTGTPVMNRPDELWSMLNWMEPQNFKGYWDFFEDYVDYYEGYFGRVILGAKNTDQLARMLAPRMMRRTKPEVLTDLPDKMYKTIYVDLSPAQKKAYDELVEFLITQLADGEIVTATAVLAKITRLKQICISLALLSDGVHDSAKIDTLMDLIADTGGKVVVFSQFAKAIGLVHERLKKAKIGHVVMTGKASMLCSAKGTDTRVTRGKAVKAFQANDEFRVFIGTTQAGGVGITLTAANTVIFLDKMWTPADQQQAEDRLHRIGQKDSVLVVNLLTRGTVEEHIEQTLKKKQYMIQEIMDKAKATQVNAGTVSNLIRRDA